MLSFETLESREMCGRLVWSGCGGEMKLYKHKLVVHGPAIIERHEDVTGKHYIAVKSQSGCISTAGQWEHIKIVVK